MLQEKWEEAHFLPGVKNIPFCVTYEVCLLKEYNAQCLQKRNPKKNVQKLCGERKPLTWGKRD